jgi:hypothetical protein
MSGAIGQSSGHVERFCERYFDLLKSMFWLVPIYLLRSGPRRVARDGLHCGVVVSHLSSLPDLLTCLGLPGSSIRETSFRNRSSFFQALHQVIDMMVPSPLPKWCFGAFCGPSIEDMWMMLRVRPLTDVGDVIPVFFPWVRSRLYFRQHGLRWINRKFIKLIHRVLRILSPIFVYATVVYDEFGFCPVPSSVACVPQNLLIISPWDWGHIPFIAFLRIPSSGGVLPEQYHM